MNINASPTADEAMRLAAFDIADYVRNNPGALLCLAAGKTPLPLFKHLIDMQNYKSGQDAGARSSDETVKKPGARSSAETVNKSGAGLNLSDAYYVGLDEWVGVGRETEGSCAQVMFDNFYGPAGVPPERICAWDGLCADTGAEMERVGSWISARGGIGLAMLGIGVNGHVGFNEPHTDPSKKLALVKLDEITKTVSKKYFLKYLPVAYGLTVGLAELYSSRRIMLVATGAGKADILRKVLSGNRDPAVPASLLADHRDIALYADDAALINNL